MTTYILVGGGDRKSTEYGKNLAAEVYKRHPTSTLHVLSCYFAEPREDWETKFAQRQEWFRQVFGEEAVIKLAFPDTFREQVKQADVIYIHGGDDTLLSYYLNQYGKISEMFAGKVVVGSSAGADWLSASFWTCDWRQTREGAGLVSLNIIVHYGSNFGSSDPRGVIDWERAEAELRAQLKPGGQITRLPEGEFVVFES
jgi:hypothetical protein